MIAAIIKKKVPRKIRYSEDVITSNVFGFLEIMPYEQGLRPWLEQARTLDNGKLEIPPLLDRAKMIFWPHLALSSGDFCEPDVCLLLQGVDRTLILLIEAKFLSGPSGWPTGPSDLGEIRGQLGRQWDALQHWDPRWLPQGKAFAVKEVLYITADWLMPKVTLDAMVNEIATKKNDGGSFRSSLFWLPWRSLSIALKYSEHEGPATRMLVEYLEEMGLGAFGGCPAPSDDWLHDKDHQISWRYGGSK
jgi:hypothetical protein